ncbi:hypothetical protein AQUCO_07600065v1 [Aquilegia coerulea]|uniref:G protein gamma domain-containing protein n=1 Tax=Aquilegia coerulea TaxID=218851 RepID=A0A2G5C8M1_AQUCA|nr:hypothetical protein AQUCO_07600065v1 [Aquilegia coerulea]
MDALSLKKHSSSAVSSLPFPCPKSPPKYPDMSGRRKELAKVQMLEREIGFLEEELKSCEGLQLASRSCKEVDDFVVTNPDPLIPANQKKIRRSRRFWKWLCCGKSCCNFSWICCSNRCSLHLRTPKCCTCCSSENKWFSHQTCCVGCCSFRCCCLGKPSCGKCCKLPAPSCPKCSWSCFSCKKVCCCFNCKKRCCNPCCLFY